MSPKKKSLRVEEVCRACLTERGNLKPIFESNLFEMMMACASITISENDGLPKQVCNSCSIKINRFFKFKKKLEHSDAALKQRLKELNMANIIAQAANDADIELTPSLQNLSESDDDEPLAARRARIASEKGGERLARRSKTRANELIDTVVKSDVVGSDGCNEFEYLISNITKEEVESLHFTQVQNLPAGLFSDGPPPLVPLAPAKAVKPALNVTDFVTKFATPSAPPLVPIKTTPETPPEQEPQPQRTPAMPCSICQDEFYDFAEFKAHLAAHSSSAGGNLSCTICRKEFNDKKRLMGHLKGHMVVKHYSCKLCGKRYPNPSTFKVHMRTHTGERPFKCQVCGKGFVRWAGVIGHMKSHTDHAPFKCNICQKGFKIASNLERHKILHTGVMPYCCSYCGKTFSQSDNLQLHIRTYHTYERPYLCSDCGKGFVSATRLNRHMWVHTGYKPYKCNSCSKAYSNSNDLKNHMRTHTGGIKESDKPHACTQCNMRFFHPCRLAKHMKIHEKPYPCSGCPRTFSKQNVLNKHVISKHNEDPLMVYKPDDMFLTDELVE